MPESARSVINPERGPEQNGPPLGLCEAEGVAANEGPTWNWRENPGSGGENESAYNGRVISVKWGESTKRIAIDGSSKAINEAISPAFGRTKRTFWLEAENSDVNSLGRDMPLWNYHLHLDKGGENESAYNGRVISVKWGESTKRIAIDVSSKAINEAISPAFGQRTKRTFWLEAENSDVTVLAETCRCGIIIFILIRD